MIPGKFEYFAPTTLPEAVKVLTEHGYGAKILAGGQSLIPAMRFRLAQPEVLIDINGIAGLSYIREENGHLVIGAMTREAELDASSLIHQKYPLLADTAKVIADPLVRNMATVGGNLAHADPANDHPATMLAYNASVVAIGPSGERVIPIDDFFVDLFTSSLAENEILREIHIPTPPAHSGGAYLKIERKVGDYAVAAVAVQLTLSGDTCQSIRIGLTNVSPKPIRAANAEAALAGQRLTEDNIKAASVAAAQACEPSSDLRGSEAYKRDLVRVITVRAINRAVERARAA
ncbi:MAG TPA: xanthine dehydrogenase family protein subunit M [Anaerolineae bacterium]|nr:xanthine dehydrogenase family protein subunit M [Anaerolineae bacterium]